MKHHKLGFFVMAITFAWLGTLCAENGGADNGVEHYTDLERAYFQEGFKTGREPYAIQEQENPAVGAEVSNKPLDMHYNVLEFEYFSGAGFESDKKK